MSAPITIIYLIRHAQYKELPGRSLEKCAHLVPQTDEETFKVMRHRERIGQLKLSKHLKGFFIFFYTLLNPLAKFNRLFG
jgi:hypothetical protein